MKATELFRDGGKPAGIYFCAKCRRVHVEKSGAENCCAPEKCSSCGIVLNEENRARYKQCNGCTEVRRTKKEIDTLRNAEIIQKPTHSYIHTYDAIGRNDGFMELCELYDEVESEGMTLPCYVFDCKEEHWDGLDADNIIENALSDWFEDAQDHIVDIEQLRDFLTVWNKKQTLCQYGEDQSRIIVLDQERFNALIGGD